MDLLNLQKINNLKKHIAIVLFILLSVGCIRKQRDDSIVLYYNYSVPKSLMIESACPFLMDDQFNQTSFDTTKMYKLDRNISLQLFNARTRLFYELAIRNNNEFGMEVNNIQYSSIGDREAFFLYGALDLQPDIKSLFILEFSNSGDGEKTLWLFNIKDNQLCSIVLLNVSADVYIDSPPSSSTTFVNNRIFTNTKFSEEYFLFDYFGGRFTKEKIAFATYKVNENGFIEFTKDKSPH
ncbi:hypothetical protein AGMMS50262_14650 [Bacteroidia bacterium]|nr:hypothetical protein AGMMS50262_14650 [Bacteroidia bacterium]